MDTFKESSILATNIFLFIYIFINNQKFFTIIKKYISQT